MIAFYCRFNGDILVRDMKIQKLKDMAKKCNIKYSRLYIDETSGLVPFFERPMGKKLQEEIPKFGIKEIVVESPVNFSRNLEDMVKTIHHLKKMNVNVRFLEGEYNENNQNLRIAMNRWRG